MPDNFKTYIRKEIAGGESWVSYLPVPTGKMLEETPIMRMFNYERISVSHGILASRIYNARTGQCVIMS
jgi:hypothetical protein